MKVLVIGGGGNIGLTGVVPALISFGHEVTVLTRNPINLTKVKNLIGDYRAPGFENIIRDNNFDAAISMITFDKKDADILLRCTSLKQIVMISTVSVMGGALQEFPAKETTLAVPISLYGINKLEAEAALLNNKNIPVTIFRPASTMGPFFPILRQLSVDSRWISRLQKGKPVIIADEGLQEWSWCASADAGIPIGACIGRESTYHQLYHLTRPDPITWSDYHQRVAEVIGFEGKWLFMPSDAIIASDLHCGLLKEQSRWDQVHDVTKLQRDFPEFRPKVSFETMIEQCYAHLQAHPVHIDEAQDQIEDRLVEAWEQFG